ncbi:MAG: M15 family metallopeptidase [Treponema sp.]|nr:M15 family metallopeptidase [Treponema sp.]
MSRFFLLVFVFLFVFSYVSDNTVHAEAHNETDNIVFTEYYNPDANIIISNYYDNYIEILSSALENAELPKNISDNIKLNIDSDTAFINSLFIIMESDPYLWVLVDKVRPLSADYEPQDLIRLSNSSYRVNRADLYLRKIAELSLDEMASAAREEGLTLIVISAYRTYGYQADLYARYVSQMGQREADRVSARPGHSQHQLGTTVDFNSISSTFATTRESRWLTANASRFGWSLSYPQGFEHITGYIWESWHYRYVGKDLAEFIDKYFEGIQQYALRFIHEYINIFNISAD